MNFLDDIFDKKYSDEVADILRNETYWNTTNVANRFSWPYKLKGSHLLMGVDIFNRIDDYKYEYHPNKQFAFSLIDSFHQIASFFNKKLNLKKIVANLQLKGMDGTLHIDGDDNTTVYIYMLCDDYIDSDIGGEFYNETLQQTIPFRHGRVIEMKASNLHCGKSFNKQNTCRFSIKFEGENINEEVH